MDTLQPQSEESGAKKRDVKQLAGIMVIVLIVIVSIIIGARKNENPEQPLNANETPETTPAPTETAVSNTNTQKTGTTTPKKSYAEILKEYVGRTIQINDACDVNPSETSFTTGTAVMFDNRSKIEKTISLSGRKFKIPATGYITMKITSAITPNIVWIDCGEKLKVGKILIHE